MPRETFYDLETARKTLPWLKNKIKELEDLGRMGKESMEKYDLDSADSYTRKIHKVLEIISRKNIMLRDLDDPLIDFPAVIDNMPAYLCWKPAEGDIEYWHFAEDGFAGRKKIGSGENILSYL